MQIYTNIWWHRVYLFLLDTAFTNAYIMHKHLSSSTGRKILDHKSFQLQVVHSLISSKYIGRKGNSNSSSCPPNVVNESNTTSMGHDCGSDRRATMESKDYII